MDSKYFCNQRSICIDSERFEFFTACDDVSIWANLSSCSSCKYCSYLDYTSCDALMNSHAYSWYDFPSHMTMIMIYNLDTSQVWYSYGRVFWEYRVGTFESRFLSVCKLSSGIIFYSINIYISTLSSAKKDKWETEWNDNFEVESSIFWDFVSYYFHFSTSGKEICISGCYICFYPHCL